MKTGDIVVIQDRSEDFADWNGLRAVVKDIVGADIYLEPLSERPDENGTASFWWTTKDVVKES